MIVTFILFLMSGFTSGFLLDSRNTSSLLGKPTYLTTAEYYGDKNQIHHDLDKLHQEQETYRDQQERSLNLLTNQLQQKFDLIEQILATQSSHNELNETKKTVNALEQKYRELELKYNAVQAKLTTKEHMYNELAQNFTNQQQVTISQEQKIAFLQQDLHKLETKCNARTNYAVNQTLALKEKIGKLEQLKNIDQLQTLQTLQGQVQTFDSRINLLTSHEQARNQDFLALYNLTTSSRHELENKMNIQFKTIEKNQNMSTEMLQQKQLKDFQILSNMTSESKNDIEQLGRYHNLSFSLFQQNLEKKLQKVVVTGCNDADTTHAGPLKFPDIKTSIGVSNLSSFQSTGKFTCQIPGYYYMVTTLLSTSTTAVINIMKNSNIIHWQYATGTSHDNFTPGTVAVALELNVNDNVWINLGSTYRIYQSCFTIFKIN